MIRKKAELEETKQAALQCSERLSQLTEITSQIDCIQHRLRIDEIEKLNKARTKGSLLKQNFSLFTEKITFQAEDVKLHTVELKDLFVSLLPSCDVEQVESTKAAALTKLKLFLDEE